LPLRYDCYFLDNLPGCCFPFGSVRVYHSSRCRHAHLPEFSVPHPQLPRINSLESAISAWHQQPARS
jgi:hypothetical protein